MNSINGYSYHMSIHYIIPILYKSPPNLYTTSKLIWCDNTELFTFFCLIWLYFLYNKWVYTSSFRWMEQKIMSTHYRGVFTC